MVNECPRWSYRGKAELLSARNHLDLEAACIQGPVASPDPKEFVS